jgi:hypothetical protein
VVVAAPEQPVSPERLPAAGRVELLAGEYDGLRLEAVSWPGQTFTENSVFTLALYWQVSAAMEEPVFDVVFVSGAGRLVAATAQVADPVVLAGLPEDSLIESRVGLRMADVPPGRYRVEVLLRDGDRSAEWDIGRVRVESRPHVYRSPSLDHEGGSLLGGEIELLGWRLSTETVEVDDGIDLTLYWRAAVQPAGNYKVFVHLMNSAGELVAQVDGLPQGGLVLTGEWLPREVIEDVYHLGLPADIPAGDYQLEVGMYLSDTGTRLLATDAAGNRWTNDKIVLQQLSVGP